MTLYPNMLLPCTLFLLLLQYTISQSESACPDGFSGFLAGAGCKSYMICNNGEVAAPEQPCQEGTLFNQDTSICDFADTVVCDTTATPTLSPIPGPTVSPTTPLAPTTRNPTLPPVTRSPSANVGVEDALDNAQYDINNKLLIYETGVGGEWRPSTQYRYDTMMMAFRTMYLDGVGDMKFYVGEDVQGVEGTKVGLVNLAAFLAQSMKETIKYNACDENNWDLVNGVYPLSNACGQLEQSYQDYACPEGSEHMQCEVDPNMESKAVTNAMWYGAPGPLFCGPRSMYNFTGYWDYTIQCDFPWEDPPKYCPDYPGQKGGGFVNDEPVMNRLNRTDVEGCCWWGRGVIQTTGICNFGILNYYLGKRAADDGRISRYPDIDFCKDPGAICSQDKNQELKWIAGMFYWMKSVQKYDDGWNYLDNLKQFVSTGMSDDTFIDAVSGIVNRGCHSPPCNGNTSPLDGGQERKENFLKVISVFFEENGDPRVQRPTEMPTVIEEDNEGTNFTLSSDMNTTNNDDFSNNSFNLTNETVANGEYEEETNLTITSDINSTYSDNVVNDTSNATNEFIMDGEDWNGMVNDTANVTNELFMGEENWTETKTDEVTSDNRWCGETQFDATRNCGVEGMSCPTGVCTENLKCYVVSNLCGSESETDAFDKESTNVTTSPSPVSTNTSYTFDEESTNMTTSPSPVSTNISDIASLGTDAPFASSDATSYPFNYSSTSSTFFNTGSNISESDSIPQPYNTFFCGYDRSDASTSCFKRCPSGSPGECPSSMSCFGYTTCVAEASTAEILPSVLDSQNSTTQSSQSFQEGLCGSDDIDPLQLCLTASKCSDSSFCLENQTCFQNIDCNVTSARNNIGIQQNYCAESLQELNTTCVTGVTCNEGEPECPTGTYCWADRLCGDAPLDEESSSESIHIQEMNSTSEPISTTPTISPIQNIFSTSSPVYIEQNATNEEPITPEAPLEPLLLCASSEEELLISCSTAQSCNTDPCPHGEICFPSFSCNASVTEELDISATGNATELCPSDYSGWTSTDCIEYYECHNGTAGPIHLCSTGLKFDKVRSSCSASDVVNDFCYGPPLDTVEEQTHVDLGEEQQKVVLDKEQDDKVATDEKQPQVVSSLDTNTMCIGGFTGWEAAEGCEQYYWCDNGYPDVIYQCGENLLFDTVQELCNFADQVRCSENMKISYNLHHSSPPTAQATLLPAVLETSSPTLSNESNLTSTMAGGLVSNEWLATTSPTMSHNKSAPASDMPPWLLNTIKEANSSGKVCTIGSKFLSLFFFLNSVYLMYLCISL